MGNSREIYNKKLYYMPCKDTVVCSCVVIINLRGEV